MTTPNGQRIVLRIALLAITLLTTGAVYPATPATGEAPQSRPIAMGRSSQPTASAPAGLESERVASTSRPAQAPGREDGLLRRDGAGALDGWGRTVLALAVVLAVLLVLRAVLKRLGRRGAAAHGGPIEVLARAGVGPRQQLLLVRLGGKLILMGASPTGLSPLHVVTDPEEVADLTEAATGRDADARLRAEAGKPREGRA